MSSDVRALLAEPAPSARPARRSPRPGTLRAGGASPAWSPWPCVTAIDVDALGLLLGVGRLRVVLQERIDVDPLAAVGVEAERCVAEPGERCQCDVLSLDGDRVSIEGPSGPRAKLSARGTSSASGPARARRRRSPTRAARTGSRSTRCSARSRSPRSPHSRRSATYLEHAGERRRRRCRRCSGRSRSRCSCSPAPPARRRPRRTRCRRSAGRRSSPASASSRSRWRVAVVPACAGSRWLSRPSPKALRVTHCYSLDRLRAAATLAALRATSISGCTAKNEPTVTARHDRHARR